MTRAIGVAILILAASTAIAQSEGVRSEDFDVDILVSYYDQDGEHSAVTGGIGTESMQVVSPIIVVAWRVTDDWTLSTDIGLDQISSASIGNIQIGISGGSIQASDTRTFGRVKAPRTFGNHVLGATVGAAKEYDYASVSLGLDYAIELNQSNTTISTAVNHYDDQIDLTDIDGFFNGVADRTTTDGSITLAQVLSPRTVGSVELFFSGQSGFLSTPFHEVYLQDGSRTTERLPDSRDRKAIGLRLNHAITPSVVQRTGYRCYDDDWGISAHSIELETHFRLSSAWEMWVYPILRYHTQTATDHFGEFGSFTGDEEFMTSDWDLGDIATTKAGVGWTVYALPGQEWIMQLNRFEIRGTFSDRDDGLRGFSTSFGFGWTF